jgi:DNA topoisomerase IB
MFMERSEDDGRRAGDRYNSAAASDGKDEAAWRVRDAIEAASQVLGNTTAVCRNSYVHPEIPEAFVDGRLYDAWRSSRRGKWLSRPESTVNRLLDNP